MSTIREVLYQHIKGNSQRQIARSFDLSRDTIRKYIELAKQENLSILASDSELNRIAIKVEEKLYKNEPIHRASAMIILAEYNEAIGNWLKQRSITHTQIRRLLLAEGVKVSNRSINRYNKQPRRKQRGIFRTLSLYTYAASSGEYTQKRLNIYQNIRFNIHLKVFLIILLCYSSPASFYLRPLLDIR